ncbi:SLC5A6 [Branchiostoma lanceolatum]|uniref:SLC5A6 protein n=1 Tax=Branchiostoma lanceolatum TaxID=7740 RepID=A0A8K0F3P2_BRALA|nr:SLC5A6 [Branchiostoma lanceolatum]
MKSERKSAVTWCLGVSIAVCCCLSILYSFLPPFLNPDEAIQGQVRMPFSKEELHNFGAVDYVIFGGMLAITAATGLYHAFAGGGQRTTAKYLMADRSMFSLPVAISVLASFLSAVTILGLPSEIFVFGVQYWMVIWCYFITIPVTAIFFIPVFHGLGLTSAYEYLEQRFSMSLRVVAACLFIVQNTFYIAVILYAPALALETVTKFAVWKTVLITGIVCTIYTSLGGMKAVIYTDVFNFCVLFVSLVTIVVMGTVRAGGLGRVWEINANHSHLNFFDFDGDPTARLSFWSLVIGGAFTTLPMWAVSQTSVQRFLTARSLKEARRSVWINLPGNIIMVTLVAFSGMVLFAFYNDTDGKGQETHPTPNYTSPDQILVYFVSEEFGSIPGIQGLFVSCLFSGTLSVAASGFNALATVTLVDIIRPIRNRRRLMSSAGSTAGQEAKDTWISRGLSLFYGGLAIALAFVASQIGSLIKATNSIFGALGGPMLGVFTLGVFFPSANTGGALTGFTGGMSVAFWMAIGAFFNKDDQGNVSKDAFWLYRISFMLYSVFTWVITVLIGYLASHVTRKALSLKDDMVNPQLITPMCRPKLSGNIQSDSPLPLPDEDGGETSALLNVSD